MKKFIIINCSVAKTEEEKQYKNGGLLIYDILQKLTSNILLVSMQIKELQKLPDAKDIVAVVISGSDKMVTDIDTDRAFLEEWLFSLQPHNIPILGICYGHQLLAKIFGGIVDYHPKGIELGSAKININENGSKNPLFTNLQTYFTSYVVHSQSVIKLPPNSVCLAQNEHENHHAFCIDNHIWGVQFHPEFNYETILKYTKSESKKLNLKIVNNIESINEGSIILNNFAKIATNPKQA